MSEVKNSPDEAAMVDGKDSAVAAVPVSNAELDQLRAKARERDQFLDLLQRTRAEFENYQKRAQKDREQERRYLYGGLVFDFLPLFDNLERAVAAAQQAGETGPLVDGVALVQSQFLDLL